MSGSSRLQSALADKAQVWGGWVVGPTVIGPEEFAQTGYDYVGFDTQHGSVTENHSTTGTYLTAAESLDHSGDPSVGAYRDSARAFLGAPGDGTTIDSRAYQLIRDR